MGQSKNYSNFGKKIVEKLRDENYRNYKKILDYSKSITVRDYKELPKNPNIDREIQENIDNNFIFLNSLDSFQTEQLSKLILKTLDETAFSFLREIEEGLIDNDSIGLTYKGKKIENIYNEFLSGTFFGEYFLWVEEYSSYGKFQD
ncbi:hypothetical protein [Tenacibaculum finnmarkense]|uniref:hypothetical protein n=1 Tax=Tenacibaculum finnmarkense TaxID=2781243 RepID=UPI00187B319F|nr:hypothetical protein [Tenacibaculum finnmarkense]MBE7659943.1 hypothetical protein [Tenacibaculum finnmarkense genomovar finnmarkense]MCG8251629.1 hypothetical protein [Tenacibaculum finnmarkense genomovar finnmarkense]MCG8815157.1 hypothetical protein [Tenacibaculum finnmarkense]MCG8820182.1 hypothetical protein [Tenacibaculum finnmarkense]MCG8892461.1 hypothetical protein [Tenacibaculum finnmarkense]